MNWIVCSHPHHMCGRNTSISEDLPPTPNCILDIVSPCPSMPFPAPWFLIFGCPGQIQDYDVYCLTYFEAALALVIEGFFRDQSQPITKLIVMAMMILTMVMKMMVFRCWWWWWWWRHSRGRKWRDLSPIHPTSDPPLSPVLPVAPNYLAIKMSILMLLLFLMMIMNLAGACACHIFFCMQWTEIILKEKKMPQISWTWSI